MGRERGEVGRERGDVGGGGREVRCWEGGGGEGEG